MFVEGTLCSRVIAAQRWQAGCDMRRHRVFSAKAPPPITISAASVAAIASDCQLTLALVNAGVGEVDGADVGEGVGALVVGKGEGATVGGSLYSWV